VAPPDDILVLPTVGFDVWSDFVDEGASTAGALASVWQRAQQLGATPEANASDAIVEHGSLLERRERLERLMSCTEVLAGAAKTLAAGDHVLLLCDLDGVVLRRWGGGQFAATADAVRLIEGSVWTEAIRGTNAIGTAVAENRAVICEGRAHFAREHHGLACYAHLVRDPSGTPIAVLDATSDVSRYRPALAQTLFAAARDLELAYAHDAFRTSSALRTAVRLLQRGRSPGVLVQGDGELVYCNAPAQEALTALGERPRWRSAIDALVPGGEQASLSLGGVSDVDCEPVEEHYVIRWERQASPAAQRARSRPAKRPITPNASAGRASLHAEDLRVADALERAHRFAPTPLPVLLLAETGTGKELLARTIHDASDRATGPFVALNCGAFPANLVDSELFGYASGAFTGAERGGRTGRLEQSSGGTLFLDEIAELPLRVQASLLRVLEDGSFFPVGGVTPKQVDLRLVCATCRDLPAMVEEGTFRSDLFYRIRGVTLSLPPLRERTDLDGLACSLINELADKHGREPPPLTDAAREALAAHRWPGNVRELKHTLHQAVVLAEDVITPAELPELHGPSSPPRPAAPATATAAAAPSGDLRSLEVDAIRAALERAGGNVSAAARELGIARSTLYRKATRMGLKLS
jgi:transcriptional regulator of acetoin/glycerol metabolism